MTSKRDIKNWIEELETASSEFVSFAEYYEYICYCIKEHGSFPAGPTPEEFLGRELTESEGVDYWKRLIRIWDGEEEPPCLPDEWEWWFAWHETQNETSSAGSRNLRPQS